MQVVTDDPIYDATQAKKNKFMATASDNQKFRYAMMDFIESIRVYNNDITKLIKQGFTENAISLLFNARYLSINDEINKLHKDDFNLSASGGGEIPILDPAQMEVILNAILNGRSVTGTRANRLTQLIARITVRRQAIILSRSQLNQTIIISLLSLFLKHNLYA